MRATSQTDYRVYHMTGRPIFAVPTRPRRLRLAGLARYQPFTPKRTAYRYLMRLSMLLGADRLVSRPADPADLAEKLMELLEDPPRRAAMGEAGRQRADHMFTLKRTTRTLMSVLDELVGT